MPIQQITYPQPSKVLTSCPKLNFPFPSPGSLLFQSTGHRESGMRKKNDTDVRYTVYCTKHHTVQYTVQSTAQTISKMRCATDCYCTVVLCVYNALVLISELGDAVR